MSELKKQYVIKDLASRVELKPIHFDDEYYIKLKQELIKKVQGKCNDIGFINKVIKMTQYKDNEINVENFTSNAVFNIDYTAQLIVPIVGDTIIIKTDSKGSNLIILTSGPMVINANVSKIDTSIIKIVDGELFNVHKNEPLAIGDYFKAVIKEYSIIPSATTITTKAEIIDSATDDEINFYYDTVKADCGDGDDTCGEIYEVNEDAFEDVKDETI
jgi:hypothetical protein